MNAIKNWTLSHPRTVLLLAVFFYITITLFANVKAVYISDMYIYIQSSQALFSGGTLYQDAIDTKNMGFLFFFYWLYWPYAKLFSTMDWFFVYEALILTLWYWASALLIHKIMLKVYTQTEAFLGALAYIIIMNMIPQTYFINQPQIAVMLHLLYVYAVLCLHGKGLWGYGLYGLILGLGFAMASPYIFLSLSIPALAWLELRNNTAGHRHSLRTFPYAAFATRGALAFAGFLLALLPYFYYFYSRNALPDWFYWQYTYSTGSYSAFTPGDFMFKWIFAYSSLFLVKILLGVMSIMGSFVILSPYLIDSVFHMVWVDAAILIWALIIVKRLFKGRPVFHDYGERLIFIATGFAFIARLSLMRPYMSYNTYIFPFFILLFPIAVRMVRELPRVIGLLFLGIFLLGSGYSLCTIGWKLANYTWYNETKMKTAGMGGTHAHAFRLYFPAEIDVPRKNAWIVQNNPNKTPTAMTRFDWGGDRDEVEFLFGTRWRNVHYNFYISDKDFHAKAQQLKPEVLFFTDVPLKQVRDIAGAAEFLDAEYKPVPSAAGIFIRKDTYDSWDLNFPPDIDSAPNPIKTLYRW